VTRKLVKFQVKANPSGQYYFPKEVRAELGDKLTMICDTKAAIVFSENMPLTTVLESMEIIAKDLKHRLQIQKEDLKTRAENQIAKNEETKDVE
jgi:bifunctional DNA-binding transcriptional regulator/antitoxin component of YhaV-PrlF toxin-antitoxin module